MQDRHEMQVEYGKTERPIDGREPVPADEAQRERTGGTAMIRRISKYLAVTAVSVLVVGAVAGGNAAAKKSFQQKLDDATIGSAQVDDNSLTGADVDETTLVCGGPGGIPGCGDAAPAGFGSSVVASAGTATFGLGQVANNAFPVTGQATSTCPAGSTVVGGEVSWDNDAVNDAVSIVESRRFGNGWYGKGAVDENANRTLRVVAICLQ